MWFLVARVSDKKIKDGLCNDIKLWRCCIVFCWLRPWQFHARMLILEDNKVTVEVTKVWWTPTISVLHVDTLKNEQYMKLDNT